MSRHREWMPSAADQTSPVIATGGLAAALSMKSARDAGSRPVSVQPVVLAGEVFSPVPSRLDRGGVAQDLLQPCPHDRELPASLVCPASKPAWLTSRSAGPALGEISPSSLVRTRFFSRRSSSEFDSSRPPHAQQTLMPERPSGLSARATPFRTLLASTPDLMQA